MNALPVENDAEGYYEYLLVNICLQIFKIIECSCVCLQPLSVSDANGIILGYKVNRRNQPWMNTTEAKISFPRSREACEVTVFAYNSAGDSPGVTLRIPAISKQGKPVFHINLT